MRFLNDLNEQASKKKKVSGRIRINRFNYSDKLLKKQFKNNIYCIFRPDYLCLLLKSVTPLIRLQKCCTMEL
jgi:hypothetical protein